MSFVQFQGCSGEITGELLGLYTPCGTLVDDIFVTLDRSLLPDSNGVNGDINTASGSCNWVMGDTSKFPGCGYMPVSAGDYIPANSFIFVQMTSNPGNHDYVTSFCTFFPNVYVIRNSCDRTIDAFPDLDRGDSILFTVHSLTNSQTISLFVERLNAPDFPVEYWFNWQGQQNFGGPSGGICSDFSSPNLSQFSNPYISIDTVVLNRPTCTRKASIGITASSSEGLEYSLDNINWQRNTIFENLDTGTYHIYVRDTFGNCAVEWSDSITVEAYRPIELRATYWMALRDTLCSEANGAIYIEVMASPVPDWYEFSIDSGRTFQDTNWFEGLLDGSYDVVIRDKYNPGCNLSFFMTSGPLDKPPEILGLLRDTFNFCEPKSLEILAVGDDLEYSLDGLQYQDSAIFLFTDPSLVSIYVREKNNHWCIDSLEKSLTQLDSFAVSVNTTSNSAFVSVLTGDSPPYQYAWSTGTFGESVSGLASGTYDVTVTDDDGCQIIYPFEIGDIPCVFNVIDSINDPNCGSNGSIYLINKDSPALTFDWDIDSFDNSPFIEDVPSGAYSVTIRYDACEEVRTYELESSKSLQVDIDINHISCNETQGSALLHVSGGSGPYIENTTSQPFDSLIGVTNLDQGIFHFSVTDSEGCTHIDSLEILDLSDALEIDLSVFQPNCNSETGTFLINGVNGGISPYKLEFRGQIEFDSVAEISNLDPGAYEIVVTDQGGCVVSDSFTLQPLTFDIEVSPSDTVIERGETVLITTFDTYSLSFTQWSISGGPVICVDCQSTEVAPEVTTTYEFIAEQGLYCESRSLLEISVIEPAQIFIPNAFSPNGDGVNDVFAVELSDNIRLEYLEVLDRWGGRRFVTAENQTSWEGEDCPVGVYIYHARFQNTETGSFIQRQGSINLFK